MKRYTHLFFLITYPILVLLLIVALLFIYLLWNDAIRNRHEADTIFTATRIVSAIEGYCYEHGEPPQSLEELVPKYFTKVPEARWGTKGWVYQKEDKDFFISVGYESAPKLWYSSKDKFWRYDR